MRPFFLGICGGSGSGKTTLAREIQWSLGFDRCSVLSQDSYYKGLSDFFAGGAINFDHPHSLEFDLLVQHLKELGSGNSIQVPSYDFSTHRRLNETQLVKPKPVIILDGILILSDARVREVLDEVVFLQVDEDLRFARRLERDVRERGRTAEGVHAQFYNQVKPMHDLFVEPHLEDADVLLRTEVDIKTFLFRFLTDWKPKVGSPLTIAASLYP